MILEQCCVGQRHHRAVWLGQWIHGIYEGLRRGGKGCSASLVHTYSSSWHSNRSSAGRGVALSQEWKTLGGSTAMHMSCGLTRARVSTNRSHFAFFVLVEHRPSQVLTLPGSSVTVGPLARSRHVLIREHPDGRMSMVTCGSLLQYVGDS